MGSPVNISNLDHSVVSLGESDHGHGGEESLSELFGGVDGELVDSHLVGLGAVAVVSLNLNEVLLEDESPVGLLLGRPVDSELGLPVIEGVVLVLVLGVVGGEDGE